MDICASYSLDVPRATAYTTNAHGQNNEMTGSRAVAVEVVRRVAADSAWVAPTLDAELKRARLDSRDAALATAIAYGTFRVLPSLDGWIAKFAKKKRMDALARAALRTSAFQLRHLGSCATHAIVNDAVSIVRGARGPKLAGFVNAIARKLAAERPSEPHLPQKVELPRWVILELRDALGPDRAHSFAAARDLPPPIDVRLFRDVAEEIERVRPGAAVLRLGTSLRIQRAGDPRTWPGYDDGAFAVQELGAQRVADAVGAQPGERIADACAGHGGKTVVLAKAVGAKGAVCAIELHESRLEKLTAELRRLGLDDVPVRLETIDLSIGVADLEPVFDRVLVDAPCSGLGTLHRRPELLLRLTPATLKELAAQQLSILQNAARLVRPGGVLLYAVCSPSRREGIEVATAFETSNSEMRPLPPPGADSDGILRLGPWDSVPTDAYQVVRWRRSAGPEAVRIDR